MRENASEVWTRPAPTFAVRADTGLYLVDIALDHKDVSGERDVRLRDLSHRGLHRPELALQPLNLHAAYVFLGETDTIPLCVSERHGCACGQCDSISGGGVLC